MACTACVSCFLASARQLSTVAFCSASSHGRAFPQGGVPDTQFDDGDQHREQKKSRLEWNMKDCSKDPPPAV